MNRIWMCMDTLIIVALVVITILFSAYKNKCVKSRLHAEFYKLDVVGRL